jgi:hypothetical protein
MPTKYEFLAMKAENLESAIHCYETALEVATLETMPEQWAMAQLNLATAYSNRIKGNRESNLKSLEVCTREEAIEGYSLVSIEAVETSRTWATFY